MTTGPSRLERAQAIVRDLQAQLGDGVPARAADVWRGAGGRHRCRSARRRPRAAATSAARSPTSAERYRNRPASPAVDRPVGRRRHRAAGSASGRAISAPVFTVGIGGPDAGARSRGRQPHRRRAAAARRVDRSERVGDQRRLRHRAGGAARQRQRPSGRSAPRDALRGRRADSRRCSPCLPSPTCRRSTPCEIPAAGGELAAENNTPQRAGAAADRPPQDPGGRRRARATSTPSSSARSADDPGLDVDAVVRKGQNDDGRDTFYVQAASVADGGAVERVSVEAIGAVRLRRVIFGNIEADFFTRDQLELTVEFVAERGGGLLVLGARSFDRQGLAGTRARAGAAGRSDRSARRPSRWPSAQRRRSSEPNTPALTDGWRDAPGDAAGGDRRTRTGRSGRRCRRWPRWRRLAARGRARRCWRWR